MNYPPIRENVKIFIKVENCHEIVLGWAYCIVTTSIFVIIVCFQNLRI